eukprot:CAMPEP_0173438672 /NCGR_PEP_ID=MMETSP1357-20121228/20541_1 /TAXON_ID=77926 /ORGANISM="Hemiselmis rufescens, Strain PCC563" /LENGTH=78 /DNA_ID=CAMNT_0014403983 /DNA_START=719 /DNA_END=952 /DNA_ORIENTATION=+
MVDIKRQVGGDKRVGEPIGLIHHKAALMEGVAGLGYVTRLDDGGLLLLDLRFCEREGEEEEQEDGGSPHTTGHIILRE